MSDRATLAEWKTAADKAKEDHKSKADRAARLRREREAADKLMREAEAEEKVAAASLAGARNGALLSVLTQDVADALAPEHSRTSCADDNVMNGERGCARCVLLTGLRDGWIDASWTFTVEST